MGRRATARFKFKGVSGSEGGGDNSIQFINIGRVFDKKFLKNSDEKWGGGVGRVGDNNILTFYATGSTKKLHFKNCISGNFFYSYL